MISNRVLLNNSQAASRDTVLDEGSSSSKTKSNEHAVRTHEMDIEGHKLVALSFNPYTAGVPIVLIHGICGSVHYWTQELVKPFLPQGPCYALSLPGHFPAVFSPGFQQTELTAETIARLLGKAIRQLFGKQKVILVGHSTGGFAALYLAACIPDMVKCVVSIAGFAQGQWIGILGHSQNLTKRGKLGSALFKLGLKLNLNMRPLHRASLWLFSANRQGLFANPFLEQGIDSYLPYAKKLDFEAINHYFSVMPKIDISPFLSRITVPTLVLTGDKDPIVPPEQSHLIVEKIPQATLSLLKGAGHLPFYESPAEYETLIFRWFKEIRTWP